jgi:DNA-binding MarR family transcriptional regulator
MHLHDTGSQTQTELQCFLRVDHSTIAKSLRRLEDGGIIAREASEQDRRAVNASLTTKGVALHKRLVEVWKRLEESTAAALDPRDREKMVSLLDRVETAVAGDCAKKRER